MKKFFNELYEHEFNEEVKVKEKKYKEQILAMVIDEDQDSVYEKTEEDMEDVSKTTSFIWC